MLELTYKLNLPALPLVVKEDSNILESQEKFQVHQDSLEIIKPEWVYWNDMRFERAVSFYKSAGKEDRPSIHTDHHAKNVLPWAINWVHGGYGTIEYWLPEQIEKTDVRDHASNGAIFPLMTTTQSPYKTYIQTPGAYLVNTDMPHRAKGWNSRLVVSIRDINNFSMPWEEVVKKFEKYIQT
jgi:hypothetical protein